MNNALVASGPSAHLDETDELLEVVVGAVTEPEGASPPELRPLAAVADSNALDAVVRSGTGDVTGEFRHHGYRVRLLGTDRTADEGYDD